MAVIYKLLACLQVLQDDAMKDVLIWFRLRLTRVSNPQVPNWVIQHCYIKRHVTFYFLSLSSPHFVVHDLICLIPLQEHRGFGGNICVSIYNYQVGKGKDRILLKDSLIPIADIGLQTQNPLPGIQTP